jgi:hypothetical protein
MQFMKANFIFNKLLLECARVKTLVIPYDYDSTHISTFLKLLEKVLKGKNAKYIRHLF